MSERNSNMLSSILSSDNFSTFHKSSSRYRSVVSSYWTNFHLITYIWWHNFLVFVFFVMLIVNKSFSIISTISLLLRSWARTICNIHKNSNCFSVAVACSRKLIFYWLWFYFQSWIFSIVRRNVRVVRSTNIQNDIWKATKISWIASMLWKLLSNNVNDSV